MPTGTSHRDVGAGRQRDVVVGFENQIGFRQGGRDVHAAKRDVGAWLGRERQVAERPARCGRHIDQHQTPTIHRGRCREHRRREQVERVADEARPHIGPVGREPPAIARIRDRTDQAVRAAYHTIAIERATGRRICPRDGAQIGRGIVGPVRTEDEVRGVAKCQYAIAADPLVRDRPDDAVADVAGFEGGHRSRHLRGAVAEIGNGPGGAIPLRALQHGGAAEPHVLEAAAAHMIIGLATDNTVCSGKCGVESAGRVVRHRAAAAVPVGAEHDALLVAERTERGESARPCAVVGHRTYQTVARTDHAGSTGRIEEAHGPAVAIPGRRSDHRNGATRIGDKAALIANVVAGRGANQAVGRANRAEAVAAGPEDDAIRTDESHGATAAVPPGARHHDSVVDGAEVAFHPGADQAVGCADDAGHGDGAVTEPGKRASTGIDIR